MNNLSPQEKYDGWVGWMEVVECAMNAVCLNAPPDPIDIRDRSGDLKELKAMKDKLAVSEDKFDQEFDLACKLVVKKASRWIEPLIKQEKSKLTRIKDENGFEYEGLFYRLIAVESKVEVASDLERLARLIEIDSDCNELLPDTPTTPLGKVTPEQWLDYIDLIKRSILVADPAHGNRLMQAQAQRDGEQLSRFREVVVHYRNKIADRSELTVTIQIDYKQAQEDIRKIGNRWKKTLTKEGMRRIREHNLRQSFAFIPSASRYELRSLASASGHVWTAPSQRTARRYHN